MATVKKQALKFKDAPKKTRKKRKTVEKAKSIDVKGSTFNKVEPSKNRPAEAINKSKKVDKAHTPVKKTQNPPMQNLGEEPITLFGMDGSAGDIDLTTQIKTTWGKFKNIFKKRKTNSKQPKEKIGKDKTSTTDTKKSEDKEKATSTEGVEVQNQTTEKGKTKLESKKSISVKIKITTLLALPKPKQLLLLPAPQKYKEVTVQKDVFPRIYRFITETWFQVAVLSVVLLVSIGLMFRELHQHMQQKSTLEHKRAGIQKQITYWQGVIRKYQDYRDGYFKLALLEYQLGNIQASESYIEKTKMLDPNFADADKLEKMLSSK